MMNRKWILALLLSAITVAVLGIVRASARIEGTSEVSRVRPKGWQRLIERLMTITPLMRAIQCAVQRRRSPVGESPTR
jgi:hypothetical protein